MKTDVVIVGAGPTGLSLVCQLIRYGVAALGSRPSQRVYASKTDGEFEAHLVALSCGDPPKGFARWSLRLLADRAMELEYIDSVSYETVRRVLKKTKSNRGRSVAK